MKLAGAPARPYNCAMNEAAFREAMLRVMERKVHWAWPAFTSGLVQKRLLHRHLEQEYAVYVRDFPQLIGRAYVQCPIAAVRRELAENLFEEETGGLVAGLLWFIAASLALSAIGGIIAFVVTMISDAMTSSGGPGRGGGWISSGGGGYSGGSSSSGGGFSGGGGSFGGGGASGSW